MFNKFQNLLTIEKNLLNLIEILNRLGNCFVFYFHKLNSKKSFRITQNQSSIAVVERNSQSAHIFDKNTRKQTDEIENLLRSKGIFRLWNVLVSLIFSQTSKNYSFFSLAS
jgi:hypothetical protein